MDYIVRRDIVSILFTIDRPSLSVCADVMSLCSNQSRSCTLPQNCFAELSNAEQTLSSQIICENGINIAEFFQKMIQIDYGDIALVGSLSILPQTQHRTVLVLLDV